MARVAPLGSCGFAFALSVPALSQVLYANGPRVRRTLLGSTILGLEEFEIGCTMAEKLLAMF